MRILIVIVIILSGYVTSFATDTDAPVWPSAPDEARVVYEESINLSQLSVKSGFFGKLTRIISGKSKEEELSLPFDIVASQGSLYLTCQNLPAIVKIFPDRKNFKLLNCKQNPFVYPLSLCHDQHGRLYITDSEVGAVYICENEKVELFITDNLVRPTGIAVLPTGELWVVDTGDHTLKLFDKDGNFKGSFSGVDSSKLHYPTFAASASDGTLLVNDALNYRIRSYDRQGRELFSFGHEGDAPGSFARPKGIATDQNNNMYVVDNLFDNIQVFNREGQLLLVIGSQGSEAGQFWSPGGIDIDNNMIYIADTFNNRIQILKYVGDK